MKTYTVTDIKWDTDGEDAEELGLPEEMTVEVPDEMTDAGEILEYIEDALSDATGFCHDGFCTEPEIR